MTSKQRIYAMDRLRRHLRDSKHGNCFCFVSCLSKSKQRNTMCQGQVFATPPVIHYTLRFCLRFRGKAIVRQDWRRSSCGEKKRAKNKEARVGWVPTFGFRSEG